MGADNTISHVHCMLFLRDWSLSMGRGGGYKTGWGHVRFYPYERGHGKGFSHAEGGYKKFWGSLRGSLKLLPC